MKTTNSNWKHAAVFFLIMVALLLVLSTIFYPHNNLDPDSADAVSGNTLLGEPVETIDVLFVGNSQAFQSISPMELWKRNGITAYVSGNGGQPICELPDFVETAVKRQNFKAVVLEADSFYTPCSIGKYAYTRLKHYLPILQYHDRWKLIGTEDFSFRDNFTRKDTLKGYAYSPVFEPYTESFPAYMAATDAAEQVQPAAELSAKRIKMICDENSIRFILLSVPNLAWTMQKHNGTKSFADSMRIDFIDMNLETGVEPIDWMSDAKDYGVHVNHSGAVKVSSFLSNLLAEKYLMPDHREDDGYESYRESYEQYSEMLAADGF